MVFSFRVKQMYSSKVLSQDEILSWSEFHLGSVYMPLQNDFLHSYFSLILQRFPEQLYTRWILLNLLNEML